MTNNADRPWYIDVELRRDGKIITRLYVRDDATPEQRREAHREFTAVCTGEKSTVSAAGPEGNQGSAARETPGADPERP